MAKTDRIIMIVDKSGSMARLADEASAGINEFVKEQQALKRPCEFLMVEFDSNYTAYTITRIEEVKKYTLVPGSMTALLDAIGRTLSNDIWRKKKYKHSICVIVTDGMENASKEWSRAQVEQLIDKRTSEGWEFIFMASNIDADHTAKQLGLGDAQKVAMANTGAAQGQAYGAAANYSTAIRSGVSKAMAVDELDATKNSSSDIS